MGIQNLSIGRRSFLSGLAGSLGGTGLLQSANERALARSPAQGDWTHPEGNAAHTARLNAGVGPTGNITKAWETSLSRGLNNDSVAVVDGTVYTAGDGLKAMDAADGTTRWEFFAPHPDADPGEEGGASDVQHPTVMDGVVYAPVRFGVWDGNSAQYTALIAVDAATGTQRWRIDAPGGGLGRPFSPVAAVDGTLLTTAYDIDGGNNQYVYAIDPADGTVRWRRLSTARAPPVADGRVYLAETSGIKARDVATGEIVWTALPRVTNPHTVMVADGTLFVGEKTDPGVTLIALDAATGTEHWRTAYPGSSLNPSGGAADDTRVYIQVGGVDGDVMALNRTDGSEHWRTTIPQPPKEQRANVPTRGVARVGNLLYVGGAALRPATGGIVWTYAQPDGWVTDHALRAVAGGRAYLTGGKLTVLSGTSD